jgi:flavin-dependent dehydrogenase
MSQEASFDRRYDVVVVGARPAGAATAMLLARAGFKVLAIDRQAYGSDTLSTHALMRGAVTQLARWGLLDEIVKAGTPAVRRATFYYGEERVGVDIRPDASTDALYAPNRKVLDRVIVDGARHAGADVRHGTALDALRFASDGRVVGARIRDRNGALQEIAADLVIGADGRNSMVAKLVGAKKYRVSEHRTAVVYGYFSGLNLEGFRWYYRPGVSVGAIPTNSGETCVFVSLPPDRFIQELSKGAEAVFNAVLAEASSDFAVEVGHAERQGPFRSFRGEAGYFRQSFGPGWALVGDAGYFKDPLTAHGITDALRDAELLAQSVANGSERALADYQASRDALSTELFDVTDAIASFAWDLEAIKGHHRRLNRAMKDEMAAFTAEAAPVAIAA